MPDRPNAERHARAGALGLCLALALGCATSERRLPRRRESRNSQELRPRRRRIHQGGPRQSRRRQRPPGARSREAARVAGACVPRADRWPAPNVTRKRSSSTSSRRSSTRATRWSTRRCGIRGRSCAPRSPSPRNGKTELRVADRARARHAAAGTGPAAGCQAPRLADFQRREQPQRLPFDRAVRGPEHRLRSGLPRRDHQRRSPQDDARRRADVGHGEHAHVLPRERPAHHHDRARTRPPSAASTKKPSSGRSTSATPTSRRSSTCCASSSTSARSPASRPPTPSR